MGEREGEYAVEEGEHAEKEGEYADEEGEHAKENGEYVEEAANEYMSEHFFTCLGVMPPNVVAKPSKASSSSSQFMPPQTPAGVLSVTGRYVPPAAKSASMAPTMAPELREEPSLQYDPQEVEAEVKRSTKVRQWGLQLSFLLKKKLMLKEEK